MSKLINCIGLCYQLERRSCYEIKPVIINERLETNCTKHNIKPRTRKKNLSNLVAVDEPEAKYGLKC